MVDKKADKEIAMLAPASEIHTTRWANALAERGYRIHLISMHGKHKGISSSVQFYKLQHPAPYGYFLNVLAVRRLLKTIRPSLLHAHYASGYGLVGGLCGFQPYVLSVWGSDVYHFPYKSRLHAATLRWNLHKASVICSISHAMAEQTRAFTEGSKAIEITPWGVDMKKFRPAPSVEGEHIVVGTVKKLEPKYGIDVLVKAYDRALKQMREGDPDLAARMRLLIVGGGPEEDELRALCRTLGIADAVTFAGSIPHAEVPRYLSMLDIYIALSRRESFGVAVVEAAACERPAIVSDVGGLPEVVQDGTTGIVVACEAVEETAAAIVHLVKNPDARRAMGKAARRFVQERYSWEKSVDIMEEVYASVLKGLRVA